VDTIFEKPDGTLTGAGVFPNKVGLAVTVKITNSYDVPLESDGG
jgi:hypothetical protein